MSRDTLLGRLTGIPLDRLLLFLDYDGTLTPIVRHPGEALLSDRVRRLLDLLAQAIPVVIVSGRELSDLRRMAQLTAVRYVASHGLLYHEPGGGIRWLGRPESQDEVRRWARALAAVAEDIPGALVEDKKWSVALHDRLVSTADRGRLRRCAVRVLAAATGTGRATLLRGKRVIEVRPAGPWNKGTAVEALLREPWAVGRMPVYIGDDRTDFDAFAVLRGRGLAVRVGGRRRVAGEDAWVPGPPAVESFLRWLAAGLERCQGQPQVRPIAAAPAAPILPLRRTRPGTAEGAGGAPVEGGPHPGPASGDFDVPP